MLSSVRLRPAPLYNRKKRRVRKDAKIRWRWNQNLIDSTIYFFYTDLISSVLISVREHTNNNLPELYHFSRIFKTQINAD
nr:hypothetical protein BSM_13250 [uncultured archaeon]